MSDLTRLGFMKSSAKAAAGLTAAGALLTSQAEAEDERHVSSKPVVAYVKNPRKGEIAVMSGDREVIVRDAKLAARIARAAG